MRIAIGYRWFSTAAGYHLERALRAAGHEVHYVGLACAERPGYGETTPIDAIVSEMAVPPDLYLWIDPAGRYFPHGIEKLPCPTACYLIDVHLGTWREHVARFFDAVFVAQKDYADRFRRAVGHDQVYWLPLAAAADVHRLVELPRIYDVGFVGNVALAHRGTGRARRLKLLQERFRTNDLNRSYTPEEVAQVYSQSRIVFNTSIAGDVTMRLFEGAACGALVLTDSIANGLEELFKIGQEVVTYSDDADLMEKVEYYLSHEQERQAIAVAGHCRAVREHSYGHRVQKIVEIMSGLDLDSPLRQASADDIWRERREIYIHQHMLDALLDDAKNRGDGLVGRAWAAWPCLVRRLVR